MEITGQFISPSRQAEIFPFETAERPIVGYARDYPAGLATGMHEHPRAQLIYAISGVMHVETHAASYVVVPTTALLLPAGADHTVRMDGPVSLRQLFISDDVMARLGAESRVIVVGKLLRELIIALCAEPANWSADGRGYHLAELISSEIFRSTTMPLSLILPQNQRLCRVVTLLRDNPADSRNLEDWAALANMSARTLARLFRKETGLSFRQWRQQVRMTEALGALMAGVTPARAAAVAGFNSIPAFGAAFLAFFGMTPGQARSLFSS